MEDGKNQKNQKTNCIGIRISFFGVNDSFSCPFPMWEGGLTLLRKLILFGFFTFTSCLVCKRSYQINNGIYTNKELCSETDLCGISTVIRKDFPHRLMQIHQGCTNRRLCGNMEDKCQFQPANQKNQTSFDGILRCCCSTELCNSHTTEMYQVVLRFRLSSMYPKVCPRLQYQSRPIFDRYPQSMILYSLSNLPSIREIAMTNVDYAPSINTITLSENNLSKKHSDYSTCLFVFSKRKIYWMSTQTLVNSEMEKFKKKESEANWVTAGEFEYFKFFDSIRYNLEAVELEAERKRHSGEINRKKLGKTYGKIQPVFVLYFNIFGFLLSSVLFVCKFLFHMEDQVETAERIKEDFLNSLKEMRMTPEERRAFRRKQLYSEESEDSEESADSREEEDELVGLIPTVKQSVAKFFA